MQKLTLKSYAVKHKMSLFSVVKLVKNAKLKSSIENENGKEVTYILLDESETPLKMKVAQKETNTPLNVEETLKQLMQEVAQLKKEVAQLKLKPLPL
ncbi:MAG: hypothetical protein GQ531_00525 [Sulfurovum sp.]|nr:hypothetical protein [Sulfurovum sp.]